MSKHYNSKSTLSPNINSNRSGTSEVAGSESGSGRSTSSASSANDKVFSTSLNINNSLTKTSKCLDSVVSDDDEDNVKPPALSQYAMALLQQINTKSQIKFVDRERTNLETEHNTVENNDQSPVRHESENIQIPDPKKTIHSTNHVQFNNNIEIDNGAVKPTFRKSIRSSTGVRRSDGLYDAQERPSSTLRYSRMIGRFGLGVPKRMTDSNSDDEIILNDENNDTKKADTNSIRRMTVTGTNLNTVTNTATPSNSSNFFSRSRRTTLTTYETHSKLQKEVIHDGKSNTSPMAEDTKVFSLHYPDVSKERTPPRHSTSPRHKRNNNSQTPYNRRLSSVKGAVPQFVVQNPEDKENIYNYHAYEEIGYKDDIPNKSRIALKNQSTENIYDSPEIPRRIQSPVSRSRFAQMEELDLSKLLHPLIVNKLSDIEDSHISGYNSSNRETQLNDTPIKLRRQTEFPKSDNNRLYYRQGESQMKKEQKRITTINNVPDIHTDNNNKLKEKFYNSSFSKNSENTDLRHIELFLKEREEERERHKEEQLAKLKIQEQEERIKRYKENQQQRQQQIQVHQRLEDIDQKENRIFADTKSRSASLSTTRIELKDSDNIRESTNVVLINEQKYECLEQIGKGGSSKVFKSKIVGTKKVCALKVVTFDEFDDSAIAGFKREIDILKHLRNEERVVKLIDYTLGNGSLLVAMECGEIDLAHVLANRINSPLDVGFIRYHATELFKCVAAVHDAGIVHSDLKPANFLFVKGVLKLIDFGISNALSDHTMNVYRECQMGTPNYMAPETLIEVSNTLRLSKDSNGDSTANSTWKVGKPADIWSCGCILYQMVYGKPPYASYNGNQRLLAITNSNVEIAYPRVNANGSKVSRLIIDTIKNCLKRDADERLTAQEVLQTDFLKPKLIVKPFIDDLVKNAINYGNTHTDIPKEKLDKLINDVWKRIVEQNEKW
ncbi:unnamed protein product [[Candida] boidinii]|uniref:Unnamed protein product n=1 Tax=Candida boidinii TaxID=5477 RepID=A0A9W6SZW9_CANBO|nr:hypothetical protein B5S30_g1585 [[Candida] boidinii]OWB84967.1 hypothetical protein B5S33_g3624 [[Candida] boidinii]GME69904.1 unnamed protein product [[Candida] boidinii]